MPDSSPDSPFAIQTNNTFNLSHGFLPNSDPLPLLPMDFIAWEEFAAQLPKLLNTGQLNQQLQNLPPFLATELETEEEAERAMVILSFLAHAYIWQEEQPPAVLPAIIAKPWYEVSQRVSRLPVLSYASYALYNWYRLDVDKPIDLSNIALLQNFGGGLDEEWFITIHIEIEAKAIPAIQTFLPLQTAVKNENTKTIQQSLSIIASTLENMCQTLERMPEHCDPYVYYHRVRPYIHGWKANPALADGLLYEGVEAYNNKPQKFKGETGAQSSIVPCLDAILNIAHANNPLKTHLDEMQQFMPPDHRAFLHHLNKGPNLRTFIQKANQAEIKEAYNACIEQLARFRSIHLSYAAQYIQKQSQSSPANSTQVGTGGTPFMEYLKKHVGETEEQYL